MKKTLLFLLAILFLNQLNAQCPLEFGDAEEWDDLTAAFNADFGLDLADETLLLPKSTTPVISFLLMAFGVLDPEEVATNYPEDQLSNELFGMSRTSEAHIGQYALKFGGSLSLPTAALVYGFETPCNDLPAPSTYSYYYKHYGSGSPDTLISLIALGESFEAMYGAPDLMDPAIGLRVEDTLIVTEPSEEFVWRQVPVEVTNPDLSLDSIALIMLYNQETNPSQDHYFIIDNMQWDIETATYDENNELVFRLGESLDATTIYPFLDQSKFDLISARIVDSYGRSIQEFEQLEEQIDISSLPVGTYYFQVISEQGKMAKAFVRY